MRPRLAVPSDVSTRWFDREALVPLSHLLGFSAADLRRTFMAEDGAPLLSNGYYAPR